jgi:hypothetical protein
MVSHHFFLWTFLLHLVCFHFLSHIIFERTSTGTRGCRPVPEDEDNGSDNVDVGEQLNFNTQRSEQDDALDVDEHFDLNGRRGGGGEQALGRRSKHGGGEQPLGRSDGEQAWQERRRNGGACV